MKRLIFILTLQFIMIAGYAGPFESSFLKQAPKKKQSKTGFDKRRLLLGPGIGAGAAYRAFSVNFAPTLGYAFHENFNAGATLGFNYFQESEDYNNFVTGEPETFKHKYPGYSFSIFGRYIFKNILMINLEPELNNVKFVSDYNINYTTGKFNEVSQRITIPSMLVGVGYCQKFGEYSYSFISLNYDLVQNPNARYYQTLDYRFGVMIQLFN